MTDKCVLEPTKSSISVVRGLRHVGRVVSSTPNRHHNRLVDVTLGGLCCGRNRLSGHSDCLLPFILSGLSFEVVDLFLDGVNHYCIRIEQA